MSYEDIINLPRHVSQKHPQMSMESRAAQFASFKALTGFDEEIDETARLTDTPLTLDEEQEIKLNQILMLLEENSSEQPYISVRYFIPDSKKIGGKYITVKGNFRVLDFDTLKFVDGREVAIKDIVDIIIGDDKNE